MQVRKKHEDVIDQHTIERAMQLHESLVNYGVSARDVPAVIFETQELYRQAIFYDQQHFNPEVLNEPYDNQNEIQMMRVLLNKFANYHLHDHDIKALESLHFPEAEHLRAYLKFEHEAMTYARFVRDYLLELKAEISVKAGSHHDAKTAMPAFYKHGEAPNGVKKLQHILSNIERECVPVNILKIYTKVCDVFDSIKPSNTRPAATAEFYNRHCHELKLFSFIPPAVAELDEREEEDDVLEVRMSK